MRITSTAKGCFTLALSVLAIAAVVLYVFIYQQRYLNLLGGIGMGLIFVFIFYVNIPPIINFMAERADEILNIYPDVSEKGLHIFSGFTVSRIKSGLCPLRSIQYYFLVTDTHKLYYKILFSHDMESAKARSGYTGYSSFEEDVLNGEDFKAAIAEYSEKVGWPLQLGNAVKEGEDESYTTQMGGYTYKVVTHTGTIQDTLRICCYDAEGKLQWGKKI